MVTTTERMVHRVHRNTTHTGPAHAFRFEFPIGSTCLEEWLVSPATSGDNSDHCSALGKDGLLASRGELDLGDSFLGVVRDDGDVVARASCDCASVSDLLLEVAHDRTLGHQTNRENVADIQGCCVGKKGYEM